MFPVVCLQSLPSSYPYSLIHSVGLRSSISSIDFSSWASDWKNNLPAVFLDVLLSIQTQYTRKNPGCCGGPVARNLPASAGDMVSIPSLETFHMPRSNWTRAPHSWAPMPKYRAPSPPPLKLTHLEPVLCNKRSHWDWKACAPQGRVAPTCCN